MDLYAILESSPSDSTSAIKKKYQELALKYHPDKNSGDKSTSGSFNEINSAWKILGDKEERQKYDAEVNNKRFEEAQEGAIWNELRLDEMAKSSEEACYTAQCRCGGVYTIELSEVEEFRRDGDDDVSVGCDTCSLNIVVNLR